MEGTTFSGHPTLTTLGNTLRSICYMNHVKESLPAAVFMEFIAAGDDMVVFCHKDYSS